MTGALTPRDAAKYLSVGKATLATLPIPKANIGQSGAERATWRYRVADLDAFLLSRIVKPGYGT